jgi:CHAT domain-containing protein
LLERAPAPFAAWQETITRTLSLLGQRLLTPILSALPPGVERIVFLPSAELFLLPLHAAPLSNSYSESERVCDRYQVSYAPSLEVLTDIQPKAVRVDAPDLYAVINPQDDPRLAFTSDEGAAVARLFSKSKVDAGQAGTKQNVIAGVGGKSYVHFSCHGSYDWNDPMLSGLG